MTTYVCEEEPVFAADDIEDESAETLLTESDLSLLLEQQAASYACEADPG